MDLNTITEIRRPADSDAIEKWEKGYAWLAGGTWLFSEPQIDTHTLIDLESLKWPSLQVSPDGLEIAATCKVVELDHFVEQAPADWDAAVLSWPHSKFGTKPRWAEISACRFRQAQ